MGTHKISTDQVVGLTSDLAQINSLITVEQNSRVEKIGNLDDITTTNKADVSAAIQSVKSEHTAVDVTLLKKSDNLDKLTNYIAARSTLNVPKTADALSLISNAAVGTGSLIEISDESFLLMTPVTSNTQIKFYKEDGWEIHIPDVIDAETGYALSTVLLYSSELVNNLTSPEDMADLYLGADDTNRFTDELLAKLALISVSSNTSDLKGLLFGSQAAHSIEDLDGSPQFVYHEQLKVACATHLKETSTITACETLTISNSQITLTHTPKGIVLNFGFGFVENDDGSVSEVAVIKSADKVMDVVHGDVDPLAFDGKKITVQYVYNAEL